MFELRQYFLLFLTATIWGTGFIGQKLGMNHVSPYTFTFFRTFIGGVFLIPIILMLAKMKTKEGKSFIRPTNKHDLILGSLCCGLCLIVAESFQQFGLKYTDVSKASFVTSMYILFVPIIGIFLGQKLNRNIVLGVILSTVGLYFLCMKNSLILEKGDFLVFLCSITFAVHILVCAHFVNRCDGVVLSCGQFFVASFLGFIMMCIDGFPKTEALAAAVPAIVYVGIMSNGIAYTLQIVGQRGISATIATLIMSLESVMGAFFGVLLLNETMTAKELFGSVLMFIAVMIAQIPVRNK